MRSPLKWAGGKFYLGEKIRQKYLPKYKGYRLVEPFAGGLGISFYLELDNVLANDKNNSLINFYKQIQSQPTFSLDMLNEEGIYYQYRNRYNQLIKEEVYDKEQAELFYYLNRCGFNGLYRVNKKGEFNVSFGNYKHSNPVNDFAEYNKLIKSWEFVSADFSELEIKENDFLFVDPPYDQDFVSYTDEGFQFLEQIRLIEWLEKSAKNNPIIITNQKTDRMLSLYKDNGYTIEDICRYKDFNRKHKDKSKVEILAYKNLI